MDPLTWLVVICAAAAFLSLVVSPGTSRGLDTFAAGFLPYRDRSSGWPQGVQEEEPVAWSWSAGDKPDPPVGGRGGGPAAEVIEIDGARVQATRVGRGSMVRGLARRRR